MTTGSGRILVVVATVFALVALGGPPLSAQQTGNEQTPAFRSGIEVVTVDVGVVDRRGQPVRGLAPADFCRERRWTAAQGGDRGVRRSVHATGGPARQS